MSKSIKDNPSNVEYSKQLNSFYQLGWLLKFTNFLGVTKVDLSDMDNQLKEVKKRHKILNEAPDAFNKFFIKEGWVAYGTMNIELMQKCIELAKKNQMQCAHQEILNHFTNRHIEWQLHIASIHVDSVKLRTNLLQAAYDDYKNERYHACIPVILMMADGIVCDVNPQQKSGSNTDLSAWDSIVGHENGLSKFYSEIIHKTRRKTSLEEIMLPYRNGILHGRDLGYANKTVAIKSWNLLFAVCDWAKDLSSEKWRKEKFVEKFKAPSQSWSEISTSLDQHNKKMDASKIAVEKWSPRKFKKKNFPIKLDINSRFEQNSPEQKINELLNYWRNENYGKIAANLTPVAENEIKKEAGQIKEILKNKILVNAKITKITDASPAISRITLAVEYKVDKIKTKRELIVGLTYYDENNDPAARNDDQVNGQWKSMKYIFYGL